MKRHFAFAIVTVIIVGTVVMAMKLESPVAGVSFAFGILYAHVCRLHREGAQKGKVREHDLHI